MNQEERDKEFRDMADSFIDIANKHCDHVDNARVGSAQLFATTRFCAFVVASNANTLEDYEEQLDNAVAFFSGEFERMLTENLQEYKGVFIKQQQEDNKYEHLMKKEGK